MSYIIKLGLERKAKITDHFIMELDQIIPNKPEFTLKSTGKTYTLRVVNLEDNVWMKEKFGTPEQIRDMLQEQDWAKAIHLIYRLLEDKSDFKATKEIITDDDGFDQEVLVTGPLKLLRAISGIEEALPVLAALSKSIMLSNPLIDKAVKEAVREEVKKNKMPPSTGRKSSTSSQASMAGQPSK